MRSPSTFQCSQSSSSSSSSSGSSSRSGSVSGSNSSGSSQSSSGNECHAGSPAGSHTGSQVPSEGSSSSGSECSQSASPKVVLVQDEDTAAGEDAGHSEDEEALSQSMVSLLDISNSDNEEAHKAAVHETACKSDVQYGAWWDEQICQGNEGIAQHDKQVNDYADGGQPSKAPDKIGPPLF